jgi:glycosyltransferase involved in cell wall biosynthesis
MGDSVELADATIAEFWSQQQPGFRFSSSPIGTPEFFADVEQHRYWLEPHISEIVRFGRWADKDVLDAGCGISTDGLRFARAGARYTGLDLSPVAVELASRRFELEGLEGRFVQGSIVDLPFDDESFDLVYSHGVVHHVPQTRRAVAEFHRVLRPGGTALVMVYHRGSLNYRFNIMVIRRALAAVVLVPGAARAVAKVTGESPTVIAAHAELFKTHGLRYLGDRNLFLSKNTDGPGNPLSKVYSRREALELFHMFRDVRLETRFLNLRLYPRGDRLSQTPLARRLERRLGWALYIEGRRAETAGENRASLNGPVLLVGPLPPPMMGPAIGTQVIHETLERAGATVLHVNTQDRRPVMTNVGLLDAKNIGLALLHVAQTALRLRRYPVRLVYVPISQGRWGYLRDALMITMSHALGKPVVVHLRGSNLQSFYRRSTRLERRIIKSTLGWATAAIALTPRLRSAYDGLVPPERVRVLENAIPDPWSEGFAHVQDARRNRANGQSAVNLLFLANDFESKGFRTVIKALAEPGLERARLRMAGAPLHEVVQEVERLAQELGVLDRVEQTGECVGAEKTRLFEWADIFAYPTENDGQPLVVIEAMAAGLPVVTSTYGGVPETVGETGIVVPPADPAAFGAALRRLLEDPTERVRLGDASRERYLANYTLDRFEQRALALFEELLGSEESDTSLGTGA